MNGRSHPRDEDSRRAGRMADERICSIEGCGKPLRARGWCSMHWWRWRHFGDPHYESRIYVCSVEGCERPHEARGWCKLHYRRWQLHGDLASHYERTVAERFWALVDKAGPVPADRPDLGPCWIWAGCAYQGYGRFERNGTAVQAQRVSYELVVGPIPEGLYLDHLCRNPPCVNPSHLEPVTPGENARRGDSAKLTVEQVITIRASNDHPRDLARRFGVTTGHVYRIRAGGAWQNLLEVAR